MRNRGLGAVMLGLLIEECRKLGLAVLFANIKEENAASQRLFLGAGFRLVERRAGDRRLFRKTARTGRGNPSGFTLAADVVECNP